MEQLDPLKELIGALILLLAGGSLECLNSNRIVHMCILVHLIDNLAI